MALSQPWRSTDFWSGVMFFVFGAAAVYVAREYPMGVAMRMGPGYFPTYLGVLLMIMGVVLAARGVLVRGEEIGRWAPRPLVVLAAAILLYAYAMETLGFIPALALLIVGSTLATKEFRVIESAVLAAVLIIGAVAIFIYGIDLPYRLFWWSY